MVSGSISSGGAGPGRGLSRDGITQQKITPGTTRRILPYVRPYKLWMSFLLSVTVVDALVTVASPLLFKVIIDDGIMKDRFSVVIDCAVAIGALAIVDAVALYGQGWWSGRIGEGLVYDLRTKVFSHVQRQPIAFFTRAQTGSLVSRLNTDVIAAQQSVTTLLSSVIGAALSLVLVIVAMFYLSWEITVVALALLPLFVIPRQGHRAPAAAAGPGIDAAERGHGLDHARAVQRRRGDAGQAVRAAAGGRRPCSPAGPRGSATSAC